MSEKQEDLRPTSYPHHGPVPVSMIAYRSASVTSSAHLINFGSIACNQDVRASDSLASGQPPDLF